jgi:hypothetical protein
LHCRLDVDFIFQDRQSLGCFEVTFRAACK